MGHLEDLYSLVRRVSLEGETEQLRQLAFDAWLSKDAERIPELVDAARDSRFRQPLIDAAFAAWNRGG
jgi:hypothetical protein